MAPTIEKIHSKLSTDHLKKMLHACAATHEDFIWFGGSSSNWTVIPINPEPVAWSNFSEAKISVSTGVTASVPFTGGRVGIIPFEAYTEFTDGPAPLAFAARGALVRNNLTEDAFICASYSRDFNAVAAAANKLLNPTAVTGTADHPIKLTADGSAGQYETMIRLALEDIRNGRYYQINLLRYFLADQVSPANLTQLIMSRGGPFSSWFRFGGQEIVSFSPEQFIEIKHHDGKSLVTTSPIKGTAPRFPDQAADQRSAAELQKSSKNLAELHMIIDLMRNDLNRVCQPGSVKVTEKNKLLSFANVHHLAGTIEGHLQDDLTAKDFFQAVCPGGSITGAPKIEVIRAIREFERRPRGYFMGHAFMQDTFGQFNSSVLIRTLSGTVGKAYEFSAGSGIVIHSDPIAERLEIDAKCNVLNPQEHS